MSSDLQVVRRALAGDDAAREQVMGWLSRLPAMIRVRARTGSAVLTEDELADVVQDSFAVIWRKLAGFEGRSSFLTWIYGIGSNEVLKAFERRERRAREVVGGAPFENLPAVEPKVEIEANVVERALGTLDADCAEIIRLKHFDCLSFPEIGRATGQPLGSVKTTYYRGLTKLRVRLSPTRREALL